MRVSQLKAEMDAQFADVKAQFADVKERFARIDDHFVQIDERFGQIDERFVQIDERFENLERRITTEAEATRRHFDVIAEDLKSDIRMLAAAVESVSNTLERHIITNASEHATMTAALHDHEVRITALERGAR